MRTPSHAPNGSELVTMAMLTSAMQDMVTTDARLAVTMDADRQTTEDTRSRRRNRNRLMVLAIGITVAFVWPVLVTAMHGAALKQWTTLIALMAEAIETTYAYIKRY